MQPPRMPIASFFTCRCDEQLDVPRIRCTFSIRTFVLSVNHLLSIFQQEGLITVWTPLQDVSLNQAPLVVCPMSHLLPGFEQSDPALISAGREAKDVRSPNTRGQSSTPAEPAPPHRQFCEHAEDIGGHSNKNCDDNKASELPAGFEHYLSRLEWHTSTFEAGDVVIFHERTIHASLRCESLDPQQNSDPRAENMRVSMDTRWAVS